MNQMLDECGSDFFTARYQNRHILADWLEENGRDRAARLQRAIGNIEMGKPQRTKIVTWGTGNYGHGPFGYASAPKAVKDYREFTQVAANSHHFIGLTPGGTVKVFGVGPATSWFRKLKNIKQVATNSTSAAVLNHSGEVLGYDGEYVGVVQNSSGDQPTFGKIMRVALCDDIGIVLFTTGLVGWYNGMMSGCNRWVGNQICTQITAGKYHSLAVTKDGKVVSFGANDDGQCNVPSDMGPVTKVAAGSASSIALLKSQKIRTWGVRQQLLPPGSNYIDVGASDRLSWAVTEDGRVDTFGNIVNEEEIVPPHLDGVLQVVINSSVHGLISGLALVIDD